MVRLTDADTIVLRSLENDFRTGKRSNSDADLEHDKAATVELLGQLAQSPTIFALWDMRDISKEFKAQIIHPYIKLANKIVRRPADIVFLTHILLYSTTLLPSAIYLFNHFNWIHGILHFLFAAWSAGPWTLLLHNHIHNNGVLRPHLRTLDLLFPYILGPLLGHTWNSYYWHHVKHHHVENNGPGDLSSTIRYQRDNIWHFIQYEARFLLLTWLELPLYFFGKKQYLNALKCAGGEWTSLIIVASSLHYNFRPAFCTLLLPLGLMRFAMMVGNWGQHCLVDEVDPDSDYRSSITLIDEASNRHCFNDGYHTSHHLNAKRHWSEHPMAFIKGKEKYQKEGALTFKNIDYMLLTFRVLTRDYETLAKCLVPMGKQIDMSLEEKIVMLRSKTRAFTDEEIRARYGRV